MVTIYFSQVGVSTLSYKEQCFCVCVQFRGSLKRVTGSLLNHFTV